MSTSTGTNSRGGLIIERTPGRRKYVTAVTVTVTSMQDYELLVALARNQGSICDTHKSRRDHRKYPQRRDFTKFDYVFFHERSKNITCILETIDLLFTVKSKNRLLHKS